MMRKVLLLLVLAPGLGCGELAGIEEKEFVETRPVLLSALNCTTCARRPDGRLWCWGYGADGQLGSVAAQKSNDGRPLPIKLPERVLDVSVGTTHVCAVVDSGDVYCWGGNTGGQTGAAKSESSPPARVMGVSDVKSVSAGFFHTCALTRAGEVWCWGSNHAGQCGVKPEPAYLEQPDAALKCRFVKSELDQLDSLILPPTKVELGNPADELVVQKNTTCALLNGEVRCWGSNCGAGSTIDSWLGNDCSRGGQLGIDPEERCYSWEPLTVGASTNTYFIGIGMGHISGFATDKVGQLFAWGWDQGQLGLGTADKAFKTPTPLPSEGLLVDQVYRTNGLHQFARVGAVHHSWGQNDCGELAYGSPKPANGNIYKWPAPATAVPPGVDAFSSGQDQTCYATGADIFCLGHELFVGQPMGIPGTCANDGGCPQAFREPQEVLFE